MRTSTSVSLMVGVTLALVAETASGAAATLRGIVRDDGTGDGLGFVEVKVTVGGTILETETKGNGEYTLTGIPLGAYTVEFRKPGYEYFPTKRQGKTPPLTVTVEDVLLLQQKGDDLYFQRAARRDVERAQRLTNGGGTAQRREAYALAWNRLEDMNVEPAGRAAYARALTAQVPDVADLKLPKLGDYAAVNPDALRRVHAQTTQALSSDKPLPEREALRRQGLSDVVIADVAVSTLKRSTTSDATKQEFVTKVQKSYGDAAATTVTKALSATPHRDDKTPKPKREGKETPLHRDRTR